MEKILQEIELQLIMKIDNFNRRRKEQGKYLQKKGVFKEWNKKRDVSGIWA